MKKIMKASTASPQSKNDPGSKAVPGTARTQEVASEGKYSDFSTALRGIRNKAIPTELYKQFERAKQLRETDDLIGAIIDTQIEFGNQGFQFYIKNSRAQKRFLPLIERYNFMGIHQQLWNSLATYSNVILHWKMKSDSTMEYINVLNPYDVEAIPGLNNQSLVYLKVPDVIRQLLQAKGLSSEEKRLVESIPPKYKEAVSGKKSMLSLLSKRDNMVLLSNNDGEFWLIANLDGYSDRLISPRMKQIYDSVENRNLLIDGDFSVAFLIKSFIMQVKTGESITSGPKAGSRQNWATDKHLKMLQRHFKATGKALWFFTDHTTEILQHFPDVKIFDPIKYISPETRILNWGGIGKIVLLGEGANFAAGFLNLKRLIAKVKVYREVIGRVWDQFYSHPTIRGDIAKTNIPKQIYDDALLKEANMDLKEKQMLIDRGGLSIQSALIKAGYDPDIEEQNKSEELSKIDLYQPKLTSMMPISEANQTVQQKKEKQAQGRPENIVPSHGETTVGVPQNPRP